VFRIRLTDPTPRDAPVLKLSADRSLSGTSFISFAINTSCPTLALVADVLIPMVFSKKHCRPPMKTSGRKSGYLTSAEAAGKASMPETSSNSHSDRHGEAVASSCEGSKGRVPEAGRPLLLQCDDCSDVLHELSNAMSGVLLNAQMLGWKLPPYSHLKRSVREIERNAQRGAELLKRWQRRLMNVESGRRGLTDSVPLQSGRQRLDHPANLTSDCEPCTSDFFPKRDDGRDG